jgi:hypothetical protein
MPSGAPAEDRKTQAKFVCVECGFSGDWVGAVNIREAGLALLAGSSSSHVVNAWCQEPTEGIPAVTWKQSESPEFRRGKNMSKQSHFRKLGLARSWTKQSSEGLSVFSEGEMES